MSHAWMCNVRGVRANHPERGRHDGQRHAVRRHSVAPEQRGLIPAVRGVDVGEEVEDLRQRGREGEKERERGREGEREERREREKRRV